mmetsp:Transcript_10447/g.29873  ORF Transcript_10447/g.29873 Transcript_10447/m.29873 type:complete len:219 (+) Transcript_10447:276-932(+)
MHGCWCLPCVASVLAGPAEETKCVPDFNEHAGYFHYRVPGCLGAESRADKIFALDVADSRCLPKAGRLLEERNARICKAGVQVAQKLKPGDYCFIEGRIPEELMLAKAQAIDHADRGAPCVRTHKTKKMVNMEGIKFRNNDKMVKVRYFEEDGSGYTKDEATGKWCRTLTLTDADVYVHASEFRERNPKIVEVQGREGGSVRVKISRNEEARVLQKCR